jgi:tripartite-type tricarboxylate transporter receptor subunit TctC
MIGRRGVAAAAITAAALLLAPSAFAQNGWPNKPVHIIVGFPAGAGNDMLARLVGQKLSENLGQPVVVENKPGASAIIAAEYVARSPADGYTLMVAPIGAMTVNPAVYAKLPYAPLKDFAAISMIASFPLILVVNPQTPVRSLADLVAYTKANPSRANIGGSGSAFQLVDALFKMRTGAPLEYVQYKSSTEAVTAVMAGELLMSIVDTGPVSGPLKNRQVKAIAVASDRRIASFADVPTMAESGVPDMDVEFWSGLFAPAGIPPAIAKRLEDETIRIVKLPDVRERMAALEVVPEGTSSADFTHRIQKELEQWTAVAKANNIKVEQ